MDEFWKAMAIIIPSGFAFASLIVSKRNSKKIDTLHDSVNGKIEKLLQVSKVADTATGKAEGKAEEKQEQKEREEEK